ncbi:MAG: amino acid permease [Firmicutes bacterium]|nr:amino acid permease [Bacillota bacterium]
MPGARGLRDGASARATPRARGFPDGAVARGAEEVGSLVDAAGTMAEVRSRREGTPEAGATEAAGGFTTWTLTTLALGTVVGGSFFLGSAIAIRAAGPASLVAFLLGGALVYIILSALSEMTVADPTPGAFRTYAERAYGPWAGFVVGWVYWTGLALAMSSEATAVAVLLRGWVPWLGQPALATLIVLAVTGVNLLGTGLLARLEAGLAGVKVLAILAFIGLGLAVIAGWVAGRPALGLGALAGAPLLPHGIGGLLGSMLIVMFSYAGFEIIGLAAPQARDPHRTVPRAILWTTLGLAGLYTAAVAVLLHLVPTESLTPEVSPLVAGLRAGGLGWAAGAVGAVLVVAILSTMLAALFGLGQMVRSLAEEGHGPAWLREESDYPRRGILLSAGAMLAGVSLSYLLPRQVYLFLVSSGGFSLLFVYAVILATHLRHRRTVGCPPRGRCQLPGYPYTTWAALVAVVAILLGMPLVPGQGAGLAAGLLLVALYGLVYRVGAWRGRGGAGAEAD